MRRILTTSLTLLAALTTAPLFAGDPCGCATCGTCAEECCPAERWSFHIERTEQRCKVEVPTHKWYATPSKVVCEKAEPCGCVTKTTETDIIPVEKCGTKCEERIKVCTTVYMECRPVMDVHRVEVPATPK
jgi:hypothetical protein